MKKIIFACLLAFLTISAFAQKTIENPEYRLSSIPGSITKIELLDTTTVLHFHIKTYPGRWVSIPNKTFIQDSNGGDQLFIIKAEGTKINKRHIIPESGEIFYTLYFPKLNSNINTIDYGEANDGGNWSVYDILVNETEDTSVLPKVLRGNWLLADGSNLFNYGFYVNNAIVDRAVWNYQSVKNKGKKYEIILERNGALKTIHAKLGKKGLVDFGSNVKDLKPYSLDRIYNSNYKIVDNKPYNESMFQIDSTTYSGVIKGYTSKIEEKTGMVYVNNVFAGNQDSYMIKVADDGSFSVKFPVNYPQPIFVRLPYANISVFVEPGKETFHVINGDKSFFMGDCAQVNTDLDLMKSIRDTGFNSIQKKIGELSPEEFKKLCFESKEKQLKEFNEFQINNIISEKAIQIKKNDIEYNALDKLSGYGLYRRSIERRNKSVKKEEDKMPYKAFKIDASFYDFISKDNLTDKFPVLTTNYYYFINRLMYADIFKNNAQTNYTTSEIVGLLLKDNKDLSVDVLKMSEMSKEIETPEIQLKQAEFKKAHGDTQQAFYKKYMKDYNAYVKDNNIKLIHNDYILNVVDYLKIKGEELNHEEQELVEAFKNIRTDEETRKTKKFNDTYGFIKAELYKKYSKEISGFYRNKSSIEIDNSMKSFFGVSNSFLFDIITSQRASRILNDFNVYSDNDLKLLKKNIKDPLVYNCLVAANELTKLKIERNKTLGGYTVNTVNKTEGDELFDTIVKKFKGKVVYVDFWATWCGPCMSGIRKVASLKEEMKGDDVVFLYITNQTSPEGTWKNSIPNIKGEHYRVSADEWNYLSDKFKISGIPHYALVNREGKVVRYKLGHRNNTSLKVLLKEELEK